MPARRRNRAVGSPALTGSGWVVLCAGAAAFAGACALGRVDLLLFGIFLVLLPLASALALKVDRLDLRVVRTLHPDTVAAGQDASVELSIENRSERPTPALRWRDRASAGIAAPGAAALPPIEGQVGSSRRLRRPAQLRYRLAAQQRGLYRVGPLLLSRRDPFGLARVERAFGPEARLRVTPRVLPLDAGDLAATRSAGLEHELAWASIPAADELSAREYQPGDPLRRVNWRATARHDTLMVRREEERSSPEAWIVLDTVSHGAGGSPAALEQRIELVASLSAHLMSLGFSVGLIETGASGQPTASAWGSLRTGAALFEPGTLGNLLCGLAELSGSAAEAARWPDELAEALTRSRSDVPVFAILRGSGPGDADTLTGLRAHCDPAVAFCTLPDALPELPEAGWRLVHLKPTDTAATAWRRALNATARAGSR